MIDYKVGDKVIRTSVDSFVADLQSYKVEKFLFRVGQVAPYLVEVSDDNGTPSFFNPSSLKKDITEAVYDCMSKGVEEGITQLSDAQVNKMLKGVLEDFKPEAQGIKYDPDKLQYSLIPPHALEEVAKNLTIGLKKYPHRDNWKLVQDAEQRYLDALIRHLEAHRKGEIFDPDNPSVYHLAAVAVNAMFLLEFMTNPELDSKVFNKE